jgi:5-methyltetrahydrofolate--homocysteine methyltransferase
LRQREIIEAIKQNVIEGRRNKDDEGIELALVGEPGVCELVEQALGEGIDVKEILDTLSEGLALVGDKYEAGEFFIPDMLVAAEAVGAAMELLKPHLLQEGVENKGKFIVATVQGDQHDIGKNVVAIMLGGAGFEVIDLGADVSPDDIVAAVRREEAEFLGLSALLTTTMVFMKETIDKLQEAGLRSKVKVLIGGAPTSAEFAQEIGADGYGKDAFHAVALAEKLRIGGGEHSGN